MRHKSQPSGAGLLVPSHYKVHHREGAFVSSCPHSFIVFNQVVFLHVRCCSIPRISEDMIVTLIVLEHVSVLYSSGSYFLYLIEF